MNITQHRSSHYELLWFAKAEAREELKGSIQSEEAERLRSAIKAAEHVGLTENEQKDAKDALEKVAEFMVIHGD